MESTKDKISNPLQSMVFVNFKSMPITDSDKLNWDVQTGDKNLKWCKEHIFRIFEFFFFEVANIANGAKIHWQICRKGRVLRFNIIIHEYFMLYLSITIWRAICMLKKKKSKSALSSWSSSPAELSPLKSLSTVLCF